MSEEVFETYTKQEGTVYDCYGCGSTENVIGIELPCTPDQGILLCPKCRTKMVNTLKKLESEHVE